MSYTQLKLKTEYREKLKALAEADNRSMANMVELLVDRAADFKTIILELIGDDEESRWGFGEATYGDSAADSQSAHYGRNDLREELRRKVEAL